jgi:hypothetical protein
VIAKTVKNAAMHRADRASGNEMTDDEVKRRAASV